MTRASSNDRLRFLPFNGKKYCYFTDAMCARQTPRIWARSTCLPVRHEEQIILDGDWRLAAFPCCNSGVTHFSDVLCLFKILFTIIIRLSYQALSQKTVSSICIFRKSFVHVIRWLGLEPPTRDTDYLYRVQHPEPSRDTRIQKN